VVVVVVVVVCVIPPLRSPQFLVIRTHTHTLHKTVETHIHYFKSPLHTVQTPFARARINPHLTYTYTHTHTHTHHHRQAPTTTSTAVATITPAPTPTTPRPWSVTNPYYCGWAVGPNGEAFERHADNALECDPTGYGNHGCTFSDCPDLAACERKCNECAVCSGFNFAVYPAPTGHGGRRCWMLKNGVVNRTVETQPVHNSGWAGWANDRSQGCEAPELPATTTPSQLYAYWDWGNCGPDGDDARWSWCDQRNFICQQEVITDECDSGFAKLKSTQGNGQPGSVTIQGCGYHYFAIYECTGIFKLVYGTCICTFIAAVTPGTSKLRPRTMKLRPRTS